MPVREPDGRGATLSVGPSTPDSPLHRKHPPGQASFLGCLSLTTQLKLPGLPKGLKRSV